MRHNKQKLFIVTELFYPEETSTSYLLTKIASKLSDKYEVNVICGPMSYEMTKQSSCKNDQLHNISIRRVKCLNFDKNKNLFRILRFLMLSISLSIKLILELRKEDKVLIVTNPAPLLLIISLFRAIRKFDYSILVHDVFPENAVAAKIISDQRVSFRFLKYIFDKAYSQADRLIVLGRDMKDVVAQKTNKQSNIQIVENWAEQQILNEPFVQDKHPEMITIQYAGNIGRVQGLDQFINCFREANNSMLNLEFWGAGAVEDGLKDYCRSNCLQNVSFNGVYARSEQNEIFSRADVAIVSLAPNMYGLGVPSKTYNLIAAGIPILYIGDLRSEIALMLVEHELGWCFDTMDKEGLINFLQAFSRDKIDVRDRNYIRNVASTYYSESVILDKFQDALND